jgi:hypothetical protein
LEREHVSQPRYLFVPAEVLQSPSPERRVAWRAAQGGTVTGVAWRLLGGNNHELGRSIPAYSSLSAAIDAVQVLQLRLDEATTSLAPSTVTSRWGWRMLLVDSPIAASGRWYQREREARYNLDQFIAAAPDAHIVATLGSRSRMRPSALSEGARAEVARLEQQAISMQTSRIAGATS